MLDVQNRPHSCVFVAVQIFSQTVDSSEIGDQFLATSDAVQVDLHRIPLEMCTVDDVCWKDRWKVLRVARWGR